MVGGAPVVHYWADLQSVHGLHCYDNTEWTQNVSECRAMPGLYFAPLFHAYEVDAVDDEKVNQQNVVTFYDGGNIRELTSPQVD